MFKHAFPLVYALVVAAGIAVGNEPPAPATQQSGIGSAVRGGEEESRPPLLPQTPASAATEPYGEEQAGSATPSAPASPPQLQSETTPPDPAGAGPTQPVKKPPPNPYKGVFYDNDFSYLDDPANEYCYLGDFMKRRRLWDSIILDVGGEYRLREHNEHILTRNNNFLLQRTRIYGDLHVDDWFRTYMEAIDATSAWEDLPPRPTEENRFDALNLFADAKVFEADNGKLWLRGGRQELLYGVQRLISPLDWGNARRTFDGVKLLWQGERWNVDGFWTRPVPFSQHVSNDHNFDHPDPHQEFYGVYMTRKDWKNHKLDLYYLRLAKYDGLIPFQNHTFGSRWEGKHESWLWELEGGYQFGGFGARDHSSGFYTLGAGRKLDNVGWNPVLWVYYDWASGDRDPTSGVHGTFNQLFPLGHKYLGWMDIVGRQNIEDWNFQLTLTPHPTLEFILWWHIFHLQQARDALYDAGGTAIRQDPTGASGRDVGNEADLAVRWTFRPRADVLFGYSHLFPGRFLLDTPGGASGRDFYYTQFSLRF